METTADDWIFEKPITQNVTGKISLLFWFTDDELVEYDFGFETTSHDVREREHVKNNQEPIF